MLWFKVLLQAKLRYLDDSLYRLLFAFLDSIQDDFTKYFPLVDFIWRCVRKRVLDCLHEPYSNVQKAAICLFVINLKDHFYAFTNEQILVLKSYFNICRLFAHAHEPTHLILVYLDQTLRRSLDYGLEHLDFLHAMYSCEQFQILSKVALSIIY